MFFPSAASSKRCSGSSVVLISQPDHFEEENQGGQYHQHLLFDPSSSHHYRSSSRIRGRLFSFLGGINSLLQEILSIARRPSFGCVWVGWTEEGDGEHGLSVAFALFSTSRLENANAKDCVLDVEVDRGRRKASSWTQEPTNRMR